MALLTWSAALSVGVRQCDDQHQKLVAMVNRLHDAMRDGKGAAIINEVVKELVRYTQTHFADEERLLKLYSYPDYEQHKKEHNALVQQVTDILKGIDAGKAPLTMEVMTFLKNWLTTHIMGSDKKYGIFLNGKGVK